MAKQQPQPQQTKLNNPGPRIPVVEQDEPIIQPIVRVAGQKNIYEQLCDGPEDELPEMRAVGYAKVSDRIAGWVHYAITFKGTKITKIEISEPEMRGIVDEATKMDFVRLFNDSL